MTKEAAPSAEVDASEPDVAPSGSGAHDAAHPAADVSSEEAVTRDDVTPVLDVDPEALHTQLQAMRAQVAELEDKFLRKAADLENTKRRLNKKVEDTEKFGVGKALNELIPVLDDLERALEHASADAGDSSPGTFVDGMALVARKFQAALQRLGAASFESIGQPFDPQLHEAISQMTTTDQPPGTVVSEFLKGYKLHDRLLRPALVIVARPPEPSAPEE